jgi:Cdc6-like AAA superfamily ATPase
LIKWRHFPRVLTTLAVSIIPAFLTSRALYSWWIDKRRTPRIVRAFENAPQFELPQVFLSRPDDESNIFRAIVMWGGSYPFVYGSHGTGKTTTVKAVLNRVNKRYGGCALYIEASAKEDIAEILAHTVGYEFDDYINWSNYWKSWLHPGYTPESTVFYFQKMLLLL